MSLLNAVMLENNKAEIRIYGVIGEGWFADVTSEDINRELDSLGDINEIDVRINSPGGGVFAGAAIYNTLKRYKAKINIYIDGLCASIATVVAMSGDTINMGRTAMMMIHNPLTPPVGGNSKELRKIADDLDKIKEVSIGAYLTKVNLTREELISKMDNETWMSADEAKEFGFITNVEYSNELQMSIEQNYLMCGSEEINISSFRNLDSFLNRQNIKNSIKNQVKSQNIKSKNTKGVEKMNLEQLMQEYPDLYKQIVQVGVNQERERIQNLEAVEQRAGRFLECIQRAKFETPLEATNQELMNDVLQEMSTEIKVKSSKEDKLDILMKKIDDAKSGGVQGEITEGLTKKELEIQQEIEEIDEIVALANKD